MCLLKETGICILWLQGLHLGKKIRKTTSQSLSFAQSAPCPVLPAWCAALLSAPYLLCRCAACLLSLPSATQRLPVPLLARATGGYLCAKLCNGGKFLMVHTCNYNKCSLPCFRLCACTHWNMAVLKQWFLTRLSQHPVKFFQGCCKVPHSTSAFRCARIAR